MPNGVDARRHLEDALALCKEVLAEHPLIVVSNRGPLEYQLGPKGQPQPRRRSSSVSTALHSLIASAPFSWVASAMGEGDRKVAEEAGGKSVRAPLANYQTSIRFVATPRRAYHKFYNIFCNPMLWFLQHYMWNPPYTPNIDASVYDAWETGYAVVNQMFAEAVATQAREAGAPPLVMFHDYHLYLAPGEVRRRVPNALLHYLMHIPWPTPHTWHILPASMRSAICQSLCACDIVGFQSQMDAHNFLECCRWFVRDAQVDYAAGTVTAEGRTTRVRVYPLTIDLEEVRQIADSPRTVEYEQQLKLLCGDRTIIRVDRAEPNKNVVRGFRAYQLMLERHPELKGEVKFLAFLVPSRTHIKQYERYLQEIDGVVREVNAAQGIPGWEPITAFYENNYLQAIAGMKLGDVILVNPVSDGMSLVAKEGPIANRKDALMVLSEGTAAWEQLKEHALVVAPADIEGTATALYQAVTMPLEERARRASGMRAAIEAQNSAAWLAAQFTDIKGLIKTPA